MKRLTPSARADEGPGPFRRMEEEGVGRSACRKDCAGFRRSCGRRFILRDLQVCTYIEIAESLELPEGTVKSGSNRAGSSWPESFRKKGRPGVGSTRSRPIRTAAESR